jgi:hypothetical protein
MASPLAGKVARGHVRPPILPHKMGKVARGHVRPPILPHKMGKVARSAGWGRRMGAPDGGAGWADRTSAYSIRASSRALTIASSFECTPILLPRLRMCVRTVV